MRILAIIASADREGGGPIEAVIQLGATLKRRGHTQELLTLDLPDAPYLRDFPMRVHAMGARPRGGRLGRWARLSPRALAWARAHVRDYDAVIVEGLWNFSTMVARYALAGSGTPYLVYTHGMLDPWFKRRYPAKHAAKQLLWLVNEGPLLRKAAAVAFTCEQERVLARQSFVPYRARERVVRFGTADAPPATSAQIAAYEATVPALGSRPYLLYLSRIHEKKGCDLLVEAFGTVAASHPDIDLVIAGPDQTGLKAGLIATAERLGIAARIHWPGMIVGDAKWGAFRGCEAFILPSHQENFGIVVAEAMACAKPVLISDQVNIWREVDEAGAGLIAPDTLAGTCDLLTRFLALDAASREAMGAHARAAFVDKFEVEAAADDLIALLESFDS